jgi:two-component system phosphate regulon response regulator PhoB
MDATKTIIILESDDSLLTILSYNLERCGYIINSYKDPRLVLQNAERARPHMIIISEELAGNISGNEICSTLRSKRFSKNTPIIMMLNKAPEEKKGILAEDFVDYVVKPFSPSELINKVKTTLKTEANSSSNKILEYKDLKINIGSYQVTKNGRFIHLGPTEFKILQCLMQIPSRTFTRDDIVNQVWGFDRQVEPRTVDVHINRLRSALRNDNDPFDQTLIKTIRSGGYSLC